MCALMRRPSACLEAQRGGEGEGGGGGGGEGGGGGGQQYWVVTGHDCVGITRHIIYTAQYNIVLYCNIIPNQKYMSLHTLFLVPAMGWAGSFQQAHWQILGYGEQEHQRCMTRLIETLISIYLCLSLLPCPYHSTHYNSTHAYCRCFRHIFGTMRLQNVKNCTKITIFMF